MSRSYPTLDKMIEQNLAKDMACPWVSPKKWKDIQDLEGQVEYKNHTFLIVLRDGEMAHGGRDPDYKEIYRIIPKS